MTEKLSTVIFIAIGIYDYIKPLFIIIMISLLFYNFNSVKNFLLTEFKEIDGIIISSEVRKRECVRSPCTWSVIAYEYSIDSTTYISNKIRFKSFFINNSPEYNVAKYKKGEKIIVYIDINNPLNSVIEPPRKTAITYFSFFEFIVALTYLTILTLWSIYGFLK